MLRTPQFDSYPIFFFLDSCLTVIFYQPSLFIETVSYYVAQSRLSTWDVPDSLLCSEINLPLSTPLLK